jgi:endonuclease/exonuclease/phosphatase family metal-dependent hydrolase
MTMRIMSYNLRKHAAAAELEQRADRWDPDVMCLQEANVENLPTRVAGLRLAAATDRNRLGLALYYRESSFRFVESVSLGVQLYDIDASREITFASFHAAPLTALNSLRRTQIRSALQALEQLGPGTPTFMVGDYNYPVFKERLGDQIREHGYDMTLSDARTYTRYRFFKGHYDFVTSRGLSVGDVRTLPQGTSDHLPILIEAEYRRHAR